MHVESIAFDNWYERFCLRIEKARKEATESQAAYWAMLDERKEVLAMNHPDEDEPRV